MEMYTYNPIPRRLNEPGYIASPLLRLTQTTLQMLLLLLGHPETDGGLYLTLWAWPMQLEHYECVEFHFNTL